MDSLGYTELYTLQDQVLRIVFEEATEFYLTGGTCLHRFYFNQRYSDDLDFFTHFSDTFAYSVRGIMAKLGANGLETKKLVDTKDFVRVEVKKESQTLQVDFINDRLVRFGKIQSKDGYKLDNPWNILSNSFTRKIKTPQTVGSKCLSRRIDQNDRGNQRR